MSASAQLDQNSNTLSDVWEIFYGASGLSPGNDADGDGFSNALEAAGTDPSDPNSRPWLGLTPGSAGDFNALWSSEPGKLYTLEGSPTLAAGSWQALGTFMGEVMQLFSIGLWELNNDGTRKVDAREQSIPTYNNSDITELARVFTGMTFADKNFPGSNGDYKQPMRMWDAFHDCEPKTLLGGLQTPARTPSSGNTGAAGLADVDAAVGNLFNHPNVGPFLAIRLIQRLITSNPSPAFVGRVASAFNDNGSGVRGDMKSVVKAILLDAEARDPAMMDQPAWGRLREPVLRVVNLARAFNAASGSGHYPLDQFSLDHLQDPMNAPSVFNFFLPTRSPPGPITQQGLAAPEFQIINASSAITGPNYFLNAIGSNNLHRWGSGNADYAVRLNTDVELGMIVPPAQINQDTPGPVPPPIPTR